MLIVISIIGILAAIIFSVSSSGRSAAADTRVKNDIRQMRWLAEVSYDEQGGDFTNWSTHPYIASDYNNLIADIDDAHGSAVVLSVGKTDLQSFCISAPLTSDPNKHYCLDADQSTVITTSPCVTATTPHVCP